MMIEEAKIRAGHYCKAFGINIPEGYEVVDFTNETPDRARDILSVDGVVRTITRFSDLRHCVPILEEIQAIQWVTPTDDDAKRRPKVQILEDYAVEFSPEYHTLIYVSIYGFYFVVDDDGDFEWYSGCRMDIKEREND